MFAILDNSALMEKYLELFEDVDREHAFLTLKGEIQKNFEMNTLGVRYINTLINQYFIKGGSLEPKEVEKISFTKKLKLN